MAQTVSDNIQCNAPKVLDNRWGRFSSGKWRPYNDEAEFYASQVPLSRAETMFAWIRSPLDADKSDLYYVNRVGTLVKLLDDVTDSFELISFDDADGIVTIDFSINDREALFPRPNIDVFNIVEVNETTIKDVRILGYSEEIVKVDGTIDEVVLDGIFGAGYILLTN